MKHLFIYIVTLMLAVSAAAQEQDAFYVYQNDGHFDGFFYDEVEKIRYSKTDTLGFEHEVFVSQEIVTADSTYRFMLTAIDSIGFHQPEIIYNPRLRVLTEAYANIFEEKWTADYRPEDNSVWILHNDGFYHPELPKELYPQPGDVFANFDVDFGWSAKVVSVKEETVNGSHYVVAQCKPIDDITDIFRQFIAVEKYSHDKQGNLLSRRVSGHPELTIDKARTRASGDFDYNLLNFSINGHIPILNEPEMTITIDPSIEGKVDIRVVYNLPFWGSKYIGITTDVALGASIGATLDCAIDKVMKTGLGEFALIPLPAATPLLTLDIGPDCFVRAEGHFKTSVMSPKAQGKFWVKLEIKDWWPSMSFGAGSSNPSKDQEETNDDNRLQASIELNGFVQSGTLFPMNFKSLPLIKDLFNSTIGGTWYVGPKFSGALNLNLTEALTGDLNNVYSNLKDSKISLSLMDFDYEVTAKVSSLFSEKKEWTILDGTLNLWPSIDLHLFPDFGECEVFNEMSTNLNPDGSNICLDCYAFNPEGNIILPLKVGVALFYVDENNKEILEAMDFRDRKYYQIENNGVDSKYNWPALKLPSGYLENQVTNYSENTGRYRVRPVIDTGLRLPNQDEETGINRGIVLARPVYEFNVESILKVINDTLVIDYDGTTLSPLKLAGKCDSLATRFLLDWEENKIEWIVVDGGSGDYELSVDPESYLKEHRKNYHLTDTVKYLGNIIYRGFAKINGNPVSTGWKDLNIIQLPNKNEDPIGFKTGDRIYYNVEASSPNLTVVREENCWHLSYSDGYTSGENHGREECSFDVVCLEGGDIIAKNYRYEMTDYTSEGLYSSKTITCDENIPIDTFDFDCHFKGKETLYEKGKGTSINDRNIYLNVFFRQ